ncbi:DUF5822 domain-containing protein [Halovenus halobia]|uniref:DUF5822 domain-containing protein n=1 Tax=Halovenus halobia TaxID=3396622 RepID=UPI003F553BE9
MSPEVRTSDPDGVDYGWVMQVTFISTIFIGTPVVTILSVFAELPTWPDRALFAVRVGAVIWLVTLLATYTYASRYRDTDSEADEEETESADGGATSGK